MWCNLHIGGDLQRQTGMFAAPVTAREILCCGRSEACTLQLFRLSGGIAMGLSYDRRVPEELLKALEPGGFAHSLVEFGGSGMWALDLQLRGLGEAKKQYRATLYVGTTKVVDLHLKGQLFALSASPTFACEANGWAAAWAQWHHDRWFADRWTEVDNYLQAVIEKIVRAGTYVKEGMVQAAIGRFPSTDFTV